MVAIEGTLPAESFQGPPLPTARFSRSFYLPTSWKVAAVNFDGYEAIFEAE